MADNDFGWFATRKDGMDEETAFIFWVLWFIIAILTFVIFLNFIIAEAAGSYNRVKANISNILTHARVVLINETEEWLGKVLKGNRNFPKYIIARKIEA